MGNKKLDEVSMEPMINTLNVALPMFKKLIIADALDLSGLECTTKEDALEKIKPMPI